MLIYGHVMREAIHQRLPMARIESLGDAATPHRSNCVHGVLRVLHGGLLGEVGMLRESTLVCYRGCGYERGFRGVPVAPLVGDHELGHHQLSDLHVQTFRV